MGVAWCGSIPEVLGTTSQLSRTAAYGSISQCWSLSLWRHIGSRLEAIAVRLKAIALRRLEAIAIRAIAIRLEAIAIGAIAIGVEAIAVRNKEKRKGTKLYILYINYLVCYWVGTHLWKHGSNTARRQHATPERCSIAWNS